MFKWLMFSECGGRWIPSNCVRSWVLHQSWNWSSSIWWSKVHQRPSVWSSTWFKKALLLTTPRALRSGLHCCSRSGSTNPSLSLGGSSDWKSHASRILSFDLLRVIEANWWVMTIRLRANVSSWASLLSACLATKERCSCTLARHQASYLLNFLRSPCCLWATMRCLFEGRSQ